MVENNGLSDRELEILQLVATGASNKEIAQQLYISNNTVYLITITWDNSTGVAKLYVDGVYKETLAEKLRLAEADQSSFEQTRLEEELAELPEA